jgi:regulator of nucleoside diphosphate kinase
LKSSSGFTLFGSIPRGASTIPRTETTKFMTTITNNRKVYITHSDMLKLRSLIESMKSSREDINTLASELDQARVLTAGDIPRDVITMNSTAKLRDLETGELMTYTLVFPAKANIEQGHISVLAPIGTAMLGHRVGDEITWTVPAGQVRLRVEDVLYQPEAAGHFHL